MGRFTSQRALGQHQSLVADVINCFSPMDGLDWLRLSRTAAAQVLRRSGLVGRGDLELEDLASAAVVEVLSSVDRAELCDPGFAYGCFRKAAKHAVRVALARGGDRYVEVRRTDRRDPESIAQAREALAQIPHDLRSQLQSYVDGRALKDALAVSKNTATAIKRRLGMPVRAPARSYRPDVERLLTEGPMTVGDVARRLGRSQKQVFSLISGMARRGIVRQCGLVPRRGCPGQLARLYCLVAPLTT